jgi:hypothetical protein
MASLFRDSSKDAQPEVDPDVPSPAFELEDPPDAVVPVVDGTGERHLAVLHAHLDVAGVDVGMASELLVDLFLDALIRTAVSSWAAPDVRLSAPCWPYWPPPY